MNKIYLALIFIFLYSCGYTPIYSSKESNYEIISFKKNVSNNLTNYVENSIRVLSNEKSEKRFNINFEFKDDIEVILKDSKGDPKKNRITISIEIFILNENGNLITTREFIENFEYNISDNKFNLRQYEKNIKLNLIEDITQQILVFLASV
tara:strand:+ start:2935 stop:3387 length:453 start_codon:yes stop_codon:yes gene_type:complete